MMLLSFYFFTSLQPTQNYSNTCDIQLLHDNLFSSDLREQWSTLKGHTCAMGDGPDYPPSKNDRALEKKFRVENPTKIIPQSSYS